MDCNIIYWVVFCCLCVQVFARLDIEEQDGRCGEVLCQGKEYQCINERCYCASGYIPNYFHVRCIKCPGLNEICYGQCCNPYGNDTLTCWHGICKPCLDNYDNFICRDNTQEILLVSSAQVAMGAAIVLGIIAAFILLYKLCAASNIRPMGNRMNTNSRLSIGSLQLHVEERLRDAPPRYTRGPPAGSVAVYPATSYINNAFVHDMSTPPPPYAEVVKTEDQQNTALHI